MIAVVVVVVVVVVVAVVDVAMTAFLINLNQMLHGIAFPADKY